MEDHVNEYRNTKIKKKKKKKFLTIFPYLAIYSETLCATYASFGGGGSHIFTQLTFTDRVVGKSLRFDK